LPNAVWQHKLHLYESRQEKNGQSKWLHLPILADERICAAIVFEIGLPFGFEFGDDALGEDIRNEKQGQQEAGRK
jgi:hypothetical protein